jgi:hypothetical protein
MEQLGSHWTDFHENFYLSSQKFKLHENLTKITGTLHEDQYTCLIISRSIRPKIRNVSQKNCGDNQNTPFIFNRMYFCFILNMPLSDNVEKYCRAGQVTDDNMTHAHCMLDT